MNPKVESYISILTKKDAGIKPTFDELTDEQLYHFCIEEDLIDSEIAYLYNVDMEEVAKRRYKAYLNQLHLIQEKLLQDHFVVAKGDEAEKDISSIPSENNKKIIQQIHNLANTELDELLDYLITNNKILKMVNLK